MFCFNINVLSDYVSNTCQFYRKLEARRAKFLHDWGP